MNIVDDSYEVNQILNTVHAISDAAKISRARFDSAIYLFCADRKDVLESGGICGNIPHCLNCPIKGICPSPFSFRDNAPSKPVETKPKKMETKLTSSSIPKSYPLTVWNFVYKGKSLEEIKLVNPLATHGWLDEPFDQKRSMRINSIENLFSGSKNVSIDGITELGRNDGRYVAFRAVVLGYAIWDGEILLRTNKSFTEF